MGKLLFWVAVCAVVYLAFKLMTGSRRGGGEAPDQSAGRGSEGGGEPMVQCARCGVHLPASEALTGGDRTYCCSAHRDADA